MSKQSASAGGAGADQGSIGAGAISADGRFVAFLSMSTNLDPAANGGAQVYVHDIQTSTTSLVSRASDTLGVPGAIATSAVEPSISADGRYVAFTTASALVAADVDTVNDVYLRDTQLGTTSLVCCGTGPLGDQFPAVTGFVASGGNRVAFVTTADLVAEDNNGPTTEDVYIRTMNAAVDPFTLVSRADGVSGAVGNDKSFTPDITPDGRYVAFASFATNLAPDAADGTSTDVFVRDTTSGTTRHVSRGTDGVGPAITSVANEPAISANGRFVTFTTQENGVVADDSNSLSDAFLRDTQTGATDLVSRSAATGAPLGSAQRGHPSEDGSRVMFFWSATAMLRDRANATTSTIAAGVGHDITPTGQFVAITSGDALAPGGQPGQANTFRVELAAPPGGGLPINQGLPAISGAAVVGQVLTCNPGSWTGQPTFSFVWLRGGVPIAGATAATYTVVGSDVGAALTCRVTATNASGVGEATTTAVVPTSGGGEGNRTRPTIEDRGTTAGRAVYRCREGTWDGLASPPQFRYSWWRLTPPTRGAGASGVVTTRFTQVGTGQTFTLSRAQGGGKYSCQADARMASGRTLSASSVATILSGVSVVKPRPLANPYGDFRIRGIDVYQTVQPNSGAKQVGPGLPAFPNYCGGGTPTIYVPLTGTTDPCVANGPDPARVTYAGVPLDQRKAAVAVIYLSMVDGAPSDPSQPLLVTLRARVAGRLQPSIVTRLATGLQVNSDRFVRAVDRGDVRTGLQIPVPRTWLAVAGLLRQPLDLEAIATLPVEAQARGLTECDRTSLIFTSTCSGRDDVFRLDAIPVFDNLAELKVRSLALPNGTQTLNSPQQVLGRVIDLFPGGDRLDTPPVSATLDVSKETNLQLTDVECVAFRARPAISLPPLIVLPARSDDVRGCRSASIDARVDAWLNTNPQNREGYDILLGIHNYATGTGDTEPGWKRGPSIADATPVRHPIITVNDGTAGRGLTAAAHEFGHALGAPHADNRPLDANGVADPDPTTGSGCGGNANGQVGESWPDDQSGRLQGTAFGQNSGGPRDNRPTYDGSTASTALFDLMSYCASNDRNAWLSAFNWNRFFTALQQADTKLRATSATAGAAVGSSISGTSLVLGVIRDEVATIQQVIPADPANLAPEADAGSPLRIRSRDANGTILGEVAASITPSHVDGHSGSVATFMAPLPAGTASVDAIVLGTVTDTKARTAAPTLRLLAPRKGTRVGATGRLVVRWASTDPDAGTQRSVTVDYAHDGRTFRTVFAGPDAGRAAIPARFLAAGRAARVRVSVSDGFNRVRLTSAPFVVAGTPPVVQITSPGKRESVQAVGRVVLEGRATDDRGIRLKGRALTWFTGNRRLGAGPTLTVTLPHGSTVVRLVARDRLGRTSTATQRVRVAAPPLTVAALRVPTRVATTARSVQITLAATMTATARIGGRTFRVGPRAQRITVPLPARPRVGVIQLTLRLAAPGQRPVKTAVFILRS